MLLILMEQLIRKRKGFNDLCQMCISICYSINFECHKTCLDKLPDFLKPRVKTLNEYLEKINCDPFFIGINNIIVLI